VRHLKKTEKSVKKGKISPISRKKKEKDLRIQSNKEKEWHEVAIFGGEKKNSSNRQI
jgi:hypothetical protein